VLLLSVTHLALRYGTMRDHTVLPVPATHTCIAIPARTPQLQSITALWPVRPADGRRLSWPGKTGPLRLFDHSIVPRLIISLPVMAGWLQT